MSRPWKRLICGSGLAPLEAAVRVRVWPPEPSATKVPTMYCPGAGTVRPVGYGGRSAGAAGGDGFGPAFANCCVHRSPRIDQISGSWDHGPTNPKVAGAVLSFENARTSKVRCSLHRQYWRNQNRRSRYQGFERPRNWANPRNLERCTPFTGRVFAPPS